MFAWLPNYVPIGDAHGPRPCFSYTLRGASGTAVDYEARIRCSSSITGKMETILLHSERNFQECSCMYSGRLVNSCDAHRASVDCGCSRCMITEHRPCLKILVTQPKAKNGVVDYSLTRFISLSHPPVFRVLIRLE